MASSMNFPATRHSVVRDLASADPVARAAAYDALARSYWRPVYLYIRLRWRRGAEDAQDLTQEFFARSFEREYLERYDASKARFRTFVRTCLDGFLANEGKAAARLKRGGGFVATAVDFARADAGLITHAPAEDADPERWFHREWIRSLFADAPRRSGRRCDEAGHPRAFVVFQRYDVEDADASPRLTYGALAQDLGMRVTDVTNELAWARREFREIVLDDIAPPVRDRRGVPCRGARSLRHGSATCARGRGMTVSDQAIERLRRLDDRPEFSGTRYDVLEEIGRGGMGLVFRARDRELDRDVAIKVTAWRTASDADRLQREARTLASLEHPGIVPVHDVGRLADGRVFLVMGLVHGARLDAHAQPLPLTDRLRLFDRVCDTVAFAHARGVVHRDLKPANIMVGPFGHVQIVDWGLAGGSEPGGTDGYMAPEQGTQNVDARADVYALGAILDGLAPKVAGTFPGKVPATFRRGFARFGRSWRARRKRTPMHATLASRNSRRTCAVSRTARPSRRIGKPSWNESQDLHGSTGRRSSW